MSACRIDGCGLEVRDDGDCALGCAARRRANKEAREAKKRARQRERDAIKIDGNMHAFSALITERLVAKSPVEAHTHKKQLRRAKRAVAVRREQTGWPGRRA